MSHTGHLVLRDATVYYVLYSRSPTQLLTVWICWIPCCTQHGRKQVKQTTEKQLCEALPPMFERRSGAAAVALLGQIYAKCSD